ncbi:MAG: hypothetical protein Q9220_003633 [cf. Caloplaca sp. 1 TL-2023]
MALHPRAAAEARKELDHVVGPDRLPSWNDQSSLPYTKALIKELHRCCGVGGLGVPHASTRDDTYNGQFIPKGAGVIPSLTVLHQDEEMYPDPKAFMPERFKDHHLDSAAAATQPDYKQRDHFNYGFGRRLCPGIHVAEQSLYIVVSRVLWGFDIREKAGCTLDMGAKSNGLIMKHEPFEVSVESRGPTYVRVIEEARNWSQSDIDCYAFDINDVMKGGV